MPKLKRLLVSGSFETTQRCRHCSRNQGHIICQGEKCLALKEKMSYKYNYCVECAALILQKTKEELNGLAYEVSRKDELLHKILKSEQEL